MSWINSNATYKQNSKNDLSFYHGFSKTPVEPNTSNGSAVTTLANATTKSGHTVSATEVWASEIPWFGLVPSKAVAVTRLSGITKKNDLVRVNGDKDYIYIGEGNEAFTEATWSTYWSPITLTNGMVLKNAAGEDVLRYYEKQQMQALEPNNNAGIDSKGFATRLFVDESTHTAVTTVGQGSVISQFAAGTDNIKNGIASSELNPVLYLGTTQKIAGTHYYDYNVSGTILWSTNVKSSTPKITCFRYIGKTVTQQVTEIGSTVKTHTNDISAIKAQLGMGGGGEDGTPSVTERVDANETALKVLLGLAEGDAVAASESIATTAANVVSTSLSGTTDGTIGKAIADAKQEALNAINAIQHFSVVVVPQGQTMENVTPVENTIYLVSDTNAADGSYIEYIAFKQGESVVTEKIGSTKIDLSGYATVATVNGIDSRLQTAEGQIATITSTDATKEGSIAKALADAKTYAEGQAATAKSGAETTAANALSAARTEITAEITAAKNAAIADAKISITSGAGIVVDPNGEGKSFTISVSDDVVTIAALTALADTVASNKTELEGKITAASEAASKALSDAVTEIGTTTSGLDTRLQTAEGKVSTLEGQVSALTTGDASVDSKVNAAKTELQGKIDAINTSLESGAIHNEIDGVRQTANAAKTTAESAVQSVSRATGSSELITVTDGTDVTISLSTEVATKTDAATAASTAITTSLAGTADDTIGGAISSAVSDLETKLTTGEGSLGKKVETLEGSVKTITETTIPAAITSAQNGAVATVKALNLTASDTDDAAKVTVTLGGTVETPSITVTTSDIASAQTLATLKSTVETHISEAAGLYLSVEKVDALPADADAKTNKIYLVPVDTEAGRAQNIHTEYIWTNGQWEIIGTTAIDINSLEASAKAAQDAADKAQGEVDAVETKIAEMDADLTVNGISVKQVDGKVTELTESLITASVPEGTTSVVGNIAYVGSEKHVIAPEKFQTAAKMPSTLTSWVADLSNLTNGNFMFEGTGLTTFIGDLSSLTSGTNMFAGCSLTVESVEYIADTLPTVTGPYPHEICLGNTTNAHADAIAEIEHKGWFVAPEL